MAMLSNITATPITIPPMAILMMGPVPDCFSPERLLFPIRFAKKSSKFTCRNACFNGLGYVSYVLRIHMHSGLSQVAKVAILFAFLVMASKWNYGQSTLVYKQQKLPVTTDAEILTGAEKLLENPARLKGKRIGVVTNHTGLVNEVHLVDTLLRLGFEVKTVFAPEHGFRGTADAGETVKSGLDSKTGLPVISLYGSNKKPSKAQLEEIDVVLFDIQDVGVRYYTYISTMHYVMEACAENQVEVIILDRPNPNGFYVDGPVLKPEFQSFVGMHPIPMVHGLTVGELALMINEEGWLANKVRCNLTVISCEGYEHGSLYQLEVKPSPNLPTMTSIYLYPGLGIFEGTVISVGRGTNRPFECIGHPELNVGEYYFTPEPKPGATNPRYKGEKCRGFDLSGMDSRFAQDFQGIYLNWLLIAYAHYPNKERFFYSNGFFNLLAGTDELMKQVKNGATEQEIRASWQPELEAYKELRKKYLLYP